MPPSLLRRNLTLCTSEGLVATPICYLLTPGNFILASLLTGLYRLPPDVYGWIVSLPFWANFLQAFLIPLLNSKLSPKMVSVITVSLQTACWGLLAVSLAWLPVDQPETSGRWLFWIFTLSAAVSAFTGVSWNSWAHEWIPARLLGAYFGRRNRLTQIAQIAYVLSAGWLLQAMGASLLSFQLLIGSAVMLRAVSCLMQYQTQTQARHPGQEQGMPWLKQLALLGQSRAFLWYMAFGGAWGFSSNLVAPFQITFLYEQLHLSVQDVSTLVVIASVGGAFSFPGWGRLSDRFGNKPVMLFCMIAWQLQNTLWCFLTPDNAWMLYGMWAVGGCVGAGFALTLFNLQLRIIPAEAKTLAISVNLALSSLATAVAPALGGSLLKAFLHGSAEPLRVYHVFFALLPTLALASCLLLARLREPSASSLVTVIGAMRNLRTLSSVLGLGFLADMVFVNRIKPRPHP